MYGSNFQIEQALTRRPSLMGCSEGSQHGQKFSKKIWLLITVVAVVFASAAFAGPSQPRLPGGNGDSRGR